MLPQETTTESNDDNCVLIGQKSTMSYVFSVQTQAQQGQKQIHIKARGRCISKAVDVSQIIIHRFLKEWAINSVKLDTVERQNREDNQEKLDRVSYIDILIQSK